MNTRVLLAHLKKDLASLRLLLAVWGGTGAILLLKAALQAQHITSTGAFDGVLGLLYGFSVPAHFLLCGTLIVRVVHLDPLIEADAFWRTRPIARPLLLGEKALCVAALALGTFLVSQVVFPESVKPPFLLFALGLFAFASVTANFSRMVILAFGLLFGTSIAAAVLFDFWAAHRAGWPPSSSSGLVGSGLGMSVVSIGFAGTTIHQYLTLKTRRSILLLALTFLLVVFSQGHFYRS